METTDNNDEIKRQAESLSNEIKKNEQRLEEIREQCNHEESKITNVSKSGGIAKFRKICITCGKDTGYPTTSELEEFIKS